MQGQDLPGVIASAALRTRSGDAADVLEEMREGRLVRGYPMRGTVFLMAATDVLWVTQLCAAPAQRAAANRRGQLGLDEAKVNRARDVAVTALSSAVAGMPRSEVLALWDADGLPTAGGVGYHVLTHLMGDGILCHGPWNGTEQNIVLTSSWLPPDAGMEDRFNGERIEAVAELLHRYLAGHGPATIRDFAWWTKLPLKEIRAALPLATEGLECDGAPEPMYWRGGLLDEVREAGKEAARPLLLPGFDEFILGYRDRTFAMTAEQEKLLVPGNNGVFRRSVVADGKVLGFWRRGGRPGRRTLDLEPFGVIPTQLRRQLEDLFTDVPVLSP